MWLPRQVSLPVPPIWNQVKITSKSVPPQNLLPWAAAYVTYTVGTISSVFPLMCRSSLTWLAAPGLYQLPECPLLFTGQRCGGQGLPNNKILNMSRGIVRVDPELIAFRSGCEYTYGMHWSKIGCSVLFFNMGQCFKVWLKFKMSLNLVGWGPLIVGDLGGMAEH